MSLEEIQITDLSNEDLTTDVLKEVHFTEALEEHKTAAINTEGEHTTSASHVAFLKINDELSDSSQKHESDHPHKKHDHLDDTLKAQRISVKMPRKRHRKSSQNKKRQCVHPELSIPGVHFVSHDNENQVMQWFDYFRV